MSDLDAEIARLQAALQAAEIARSTQQLRIWQIGDQVRVLADSRMGPKAPRIGDLGTVVAVRPKAEAMAVYGNCAERVYLLDFGPDENCCDGRDTWGFADGDLGSADTPAPKKRKRKRRA